MGQEARIKVVLDGIDEAGRQLDSLERRGGSNPGGGGGGGGRGGGGGGFFGGGGFLGTGMSGGLAAELGALTFLLKDVLGSLTAGLGNFADSLQNTVKQGVNKATGAAGFDLDSSAARERATARATRETVALGGETMGMMSEGQTRKYWYGLKEMYERQEMGRIKAENTVNIEYMSNIFKGLGL